MGFSAKYIFPLKTPLMLLKFQYLTAFIRKQNIFDIMFLLVSLFFRETLLSLQTCGSRARSCSSGGGRGAGTAEAHRWRCGSSTPGLWLRSRAAGWPAGSGAPLLPPARLSAGEDSRLKFRAPEPACASLQQGQKRSVDPATAAAHKGAFGSPGGRRVSGTALRCPECCGQPGSPALRPSACSVWRTAAHPLHVGARQQRLLVSAHGRVCRARRDSASCVRVLWTTFRGAFSPGYAHSCRARHT